MNRFVSIFAGFILLGFFCYCSNLAAESSARIVDDNKPNYEELVAAHTFPFVAPTERQIRIKQNYSRLAIGLTKAQVVEILGEPDYSQQVYSKSKSPGYLGSSWIYVFEKPNPNITNLKRDLAVQVFFDIKGRTHWIVSNIKGLNNIGSPRN
jgi:hypothetical protein